jgi:hypothetical protein
MELLSAFRTEFNFSANSVGKGHLFCHSFMRKFAEKMIKSLICMDRRDHLFCDPTGGGTRPLGGFRLDDGGTGGLRSNSSARACGDRLATELGLSE